MSEVQAATAAEPARKKKVKKTVKPKQAEEDYVPRQRDPRPATKLSFYDKELYDLCRLYTGRNVWYYRDRLSVPRGPCAMHVMRHCWMNGVIDENTLVWGQGLVDWLPVRNVRTLVPHIRTVEVQIGTWIKKNLALKPAINRARKQRPEQRSVAAELGVSQVDFMY